MIRAGAALGAAATLALAANAAAQSDTRLSADVSATAGYSNNPFTLNGGDTGAGVVTLDIAPVYQLLMPRSTVTVSADANLQQYLSHYGRNDSYAGAVDYTGRPGVHTTTHLRLDVSSSILGAYNNYLPLAGPSAFAPVGTGGNVAGTAAGTGIVGGAPVVDPGAIQPVVATPLVPYTDVGLYGTRSRRRAAGLSGDVGFTVSPRDTISIAGYAQATRYGDAVNTLFNGNYEAYGGSVGWQRLLSSKLSAGISGSAATYDYHSGYPDSQVGSVQATATFQINERWSGSGALGVSFVNGGGLVSTRSTSLSGNIDLCRRGPYSQLCAQAARQVSPTGFAGSQYVTTAGLTWRRRLDERQNVSLGASYSKVGGGQLIVPGTIPFDDEYVQATAGYNRRLGTRLSLVVAADYRKLLGNNNFDRRADYGGQAGLSYRFGDRR